ncbi:MAG: RNA polymerase subunit sigma-70, partial [Duncaniella sp.]|nr:RNA polymerase subunit sigma-70 [Duncaniella sp.]
SRGDQLREMYRLIGGLPKMDKALILLWLNEKSYDEIAEIAGLTRNTVATRLRRIKQKLVEQNNK